MNYKLFGNYWRGYALVAGVVLFAMVFAISFGAPVRMFLAIPGSNYMTVMAAPFLIVLALLVFRLMRRGSQRPLKTILRIMRREKYWLFRAIFILFCFLTVAKGFGGIKPRISYIQPFYADPVIANLDRMLFFGTDPWRITHAILGPVGTVVIDRIYILFFVFVGLSVVAMVTAKDHAFQLRALFTAFSIWFGLGVVMAITFSSVGPVFYEHYYGSDRFAPLVKELRATNETYPLSMIFITDWLREQADKGTFGSGISAMPSLHIAQTYFFYLLTRGMTTMLIPRVLMAFLVVAMWIGSVHLAWHYALDGIVSVAFVSMFWWLSGRLVKWCHVARTPSVRGTQLPTDSSVDRGDRPSITPAGI